MSGHIDAHCTLPSLDIHFKDVKIACHGFRRKVRTNIGKAIDAAIKVDAFPDQRVGRRLIGQIELHRLGRAAGGGDPLRSEEHTSELQSLMRISYAVFCLKKTNKNTT